MSRRRGHNLFRGALIFALSLSSECFAADLLPPACRNFLAISPSSQPELAFFTRDGREMRRGRYIWGNGTVAWIPRNSTQTVYSTPRYITGSASHLAILRGYVGHQEYLRIMQSPNPEAAAEATMKAVEDKIVIAKGPDLTTMWDNVSQAIKSVPLNEPIPGEVLDQAFALLASYGIYGDGMVDYVARNRAKLEPDLSRSGVDLIGMVVTVIEGSVEAWRSAGTSEELQAQTSKFTVLERAYKPAHDIGQLPQAPPGSLLWLPFHMNFITSLQKLFGQDRIIYQQGRGQGGSAEYRQVYEDFTGHHKRRAVIYSPLNVALHPDGSYRTEVKGTSPASVTEGRWRD